MLGLQIRIPRSTGEKVEKHVCFILVICYLKSEDIMTDAIFQISTFVRLAVGMRVIYNCPQMSMENFHSDRFFKSIEVEQQP